MNDHLPDVEIQHENWQRLGRRYLDQAPCRHWIDRDSITLVPGDVLGVGTTKIGPLVNFHCEECGAVAEVPVIEAIGLWAEMADVPWEAM